MGFTSGTWESWNGDFRILHQICEVSHRISAGFPQDFTENVCKKYVFNIFVEISVGIFCGDFLGKCCQNMFPLFLLTFLLVLFVRIFFGISSELFLYFLGAGHC